MQNRTEPTNIVSYVPLVKDFTDFNSEITAALEQIKRTVGIGLSLPDVMEVIWSNTIPILPHDRIGLSFIENDGQRVSSHFFRTSYDPSSVKLGHNYSAGLANSSLQQILEQHSVRIIHDLPLYLHLNPLSHSSKLLVDEGIGSNLTLPLLVDQRYVGFLFFSSKKTHAFSDLHARVLLAVSDIISQNLEKVWRIRKLEESRQDYLTLLGFVSHEMKSPLSALMSVGSTYLKGYLGPVDPLAENTLKKIMRISGYLVNMVNNYLDLSRLESGEMNFSPKPGIGFKEEVLDFALDTVSARADERGTRVSLEVPGSDFVITGDVDLLRIVAVNLLDNAVKYGSDNGEVKVKLSLVEGMLVFSVRNNGVGFDKEQAKKLFHRFSRLKQKGTEDRRGSGLGLYLTWWIIQKHRGRITADSKPGQWAEFTVYLPIGS